MLREDGLECAVGLGGRKGPGGRCRCPRIGAPDGHTHQHEQHRLAAARRQQYAQRNQQQAGYDKPLIALAGHDAHAFLPRAVIRPT